MTDHSDDLESGWRLIGHDGGNRQVRLLIGQSRLATAYLGLTVGRHPMLSELVIQDATVSRRHLRISRDGTGLFVEDVNSLNGTLLDGKRLPPFTPEKLTEGQHLVLGQVVLTVERLTDSTHPEGNPENHEAAQ